MNRVKRAIIMAAGIGRRMRPITLETPKPLVRVNGVRMIDTVIQGLRANGILEIYIVVGYKKEMFHILEKEYPGVVLVENTDYNRCNNISSLYAARNYIEDAIILDGDQIIHNNAILCPEFEYSGYNCAWTEHKTEEWLLTVRNNIITHCSRDGGDRGWQLFSISRWSREDGRKLKRHLEIEFKKNKNRQIYWDDVALFCYPKEYQLGIYKMQWGDVTEVDNIYELAALDKSYQIFIPKD